MYRVIKGKAEYSDEIMGGQEYTGSKMHDSQAEAEAGMKHLSRAVRVAKVTFDDSQDRLNGG